jgi:hypothetical protein
MVAEHTAQGRGRDLRRDVDTQRVTHAMRSAIRYSRRRPRPTNRSIMRLRHASEEIRGYYYSYHQEETGG